MSDEESVSELLKRVLVAEKPAQMAAEYFEKLARAELLDELASLEKLRQIRGCGGLANRLEQAARQAQRRVATKLRVVTRDSHAPPLTEAIGAPADWPPLRIPDGWEANPGGVSRCTTRDGEPVSVPLCSDPWLVIGSRRNVGTAHGEEWLVIGYRRFGTWRTMRVPRALARDGRGIVSFASEGLDVASTTARLAVDWVRACEAQDLPWAEMTTRTGWHGDVYIAGPGGPIELDDPQGERSGWTQRGTWDGWLSAVQHITKQPVAALVLAACAVGPLLPWLDLGFNPIVDISGPHCTGKTTALRVGGSGWGCPDEGAGNVIRTWDTTLTAVERTAAGTWHAPLLLDETGRISKLEQLRAAIYALVQGRGRARGTPGGMQRTATWQNVIISSGESPLVSYTEAGGARGRPLSITTTPAISSLEAAQEIERGISANYGHLAPRLAEEARKLGSQLKELHRKALEKWASQTPGADTRMLSTAAAIEVAADVLIGMGIPLGDGWRAELASAVSVLGSLADQAGRALDVVREELARHQHLYHGQEKIRTVSAAYAGRPAVTEAVIPNDYRGIWRDDSDWVGILPGVLRDVLSAAGHDPEPVLVKWHQDGTLLPGSKNRKKQARIGESKVGVYAISTAKLWPNDDPEKEP